MLLKNSEKKDNNRLEFTVVSDAQEFEKAVNATYLKEKKQIAIPGFRKGKAPLALIEGMYGPDVFNQGALDELAQPAFETGLKEGNFKMIGMPAIVAADVTPDRCATFTFVIELYPEVELGQYEGLEVVDPGLKATDEDVEMELNAKRKQNARMVSVDDRAAEMGDTCNIDYEGFLDKEKTTPFDGGKADGFDLELGSHSFVPGFEEQVVGMKVGETKDINITFPKEYHEELAGKDVVFQIKLNEIKFAELPELDDEFAKDVSEFDTLQEYKESILKDIQKRKEDQNKATMRNEAIMKAIDNMKVEVPETMVRAHIDAIIRNFASNYGLSDPEISTETLASMLGIDENTMNTAIRPSAVNEAKTELLVNAIIDKENIDGTDEEIEAYVNRIADSVKAKADEVKKYFGMDYIRNEFKKEAAMNRIADSVKIVKETKKAAKKKAEDKVEEKAEKAAKTKKAEKEPAEKKTTAKKSTAKKAEKKED